MLKGLVENVLRRFERKLVYVPRNTVWGSDLWEDLRTVIASENPICLDVGANIGQTIERFLGTFKQPTIHAFEPSPASFEQLRRYETNPLVRIHNEGVGDVAGELLFNEYRSSDLSSFLSISDSLESRFSGAQAKRTLLRKVVTIDDFLSQQSMASVDVLKSDTQGFELKVLHGAAASLENGAIKTVLLEMNFIQVYDGQSSVAEIFDFLSGKGYGLVDLYEKERRHNQIQWCNALFGLKPGRADAKS
jgi:FkbM family methyltransferase